MNLLMKKTLWALVRSTSGGRVALARWTVSDIFELALDECNLLQRRGGEYRTQFKIFTVATPCMDKILSLRGKIVRVPYPAYAITQYAQSLAAYFSSESCGQGAEERQ